MVRMHYGFLLGFIVAFFLLSKLVSLSFCLRLILRLDLLSLFLFSTLTLILILSINFSLLEFSSVVLDICVGDTEGFFRIFDFLVDNRQHQMFRCVQLCIDFLQALV